VKSCFNFREIKDFYSQFDYEGGTFFLLLVREGTSEREESYETGKKEKYISGSSCASGVVTWKSAGQVKGGQVDIRRRGFWRGAGKTDSIERDGGGKDYAQQKKGGKGGQMGGRTHRPCKRKNPVVGETGRNLLRMKPDYVNMNAELGKEDSAHEESKDPSGVRFF